MKTIKVLILILLSNVLFVSCTSNTYEQISAKVDANAVPTYVKDFKPIIESKCIGCHGSATSQAQYPPLDTYEQVKTATEFGDVLCRINGSCGEIMPPSGKLPQATIDVIKKWSVTGYSNQ